MVHPTRFALPDEDYLTLLGEAIYVFNSNAAFLVENLLCSGAPDWYALMDMTSGRLQRDAKKWLIDEENEEVLKLFGELASERNRIVHSFPVTYEGRQELRTKTKVGDKRRPNHQYQIDRDMLRSFVDKNQELSEELYKCRDRNTAASPVG